MGDLLRDLAARYGHEFARWVLDDGELAKLAIVLVNGHDVRQLERLATPLRAERRGRDLSARRRRLRETWT